MSVEINHGDDFSNNSGVGGALTVVKCLVLAHVRWAPLALFCWHGGDNYVLKYGYVTSTKAPLRSHLLRFSAIITNAQNCASMPPRTNAASAFCALSCAGKRRRRGKVTARRHSARRCSTLHARGAAARWHGEHIHSSRAAKLILRPVVDAKMVASPSP